MIRRETATTLLAQRLTNEVIVTNLGQNTIDYQQLADRDLNCYTFGSMGQCSSVAAGIALARPDVKVISIDGDGSLLMNLGVICTTANLQQPNLAIVVLDNEQYVTTGGQPTASSGRTSIAGLARGAGFDDDKVIEATNDEELDRAYERIVNEDGPFVLVVKIESAPANGKLDRDLLWYKLRFMRAIEKLPVGVR
jgi:thiamine pyrophosphate-dependent acetolactate synthase large subunit-like protein